METVQNRLLSMADEEYLAFSAPLIPSVPREKMIGIRVPLLRKYAREIKNSEQALEFMDELPHYYMEENHLHGFLIENIRDFDTCISRLDRFLPFVDNWATCDGIRPPIFKNNRTDLLPHVLSWLGSEHLYVKRFALEMLMCHYLDDENFSPEYPALAAKIPPGEYYLDMMVAWYFATALAKQWEKVFPFIEQKILPSTTHNKAIQKALESYRISPGQKALLRTLKLSGAKSDRQN